MKCDQLIPGVMLLLICLIGSLSAQEFPVEIDLVPPANLLVVVATPDAEAEVGEGWMAPERVCLLCEEKVGPKGCGCRRPLTQDGAERLFARLGKILVQKGGKQLALGRRVTVQAVSGPELRRLGGEKLLGLYQDGVVYVSLDLSTQEAFAVLAHEYGHAWLFEHRGDIDTPSEMLFEGFAEFFSYLAATEVGDHRTATNISQFDTSIYGRGARRMLALYHRSGLDEVLRVAVEGRR